MTQFSRTLLALALSGLGIGAVSAQQTLTFTNTDTDPGTAGNQNQSVTLLAGSSVSIAPDGNVSAQCALTGQLCTGTGSGGGAAPTVSLAASNFSNTPTSGEYPAGTTFTLTPTVANGEICIRTVSPTTPAGTNWPATLVGPTFAAQTVALATGSSTYQFGMRCFNAGGATTSTLADIRTLPGNPPDSCTGFQVPLPAGWSRSGIVRTEQVPGVELFNTFWSPFPNSSLTGYLITTQSQYHAIEFNTPAEGAEWNAQSRLFSWDRAQQQNAVDNSLAYVTISRCPGDFRFPPLDQVAPANDPTFAAGCTNFRRGFVGGARDVAANIGYQIGAGVATESTCFLARGQRYFINYIRANPADGAIGTPVQEATCVNGDPTSCGSQMRYN